MLFTVILVRHLGFRQFKIYIELKLVLYQLRYI